MTVYRAEGYFEAPNWSRDGKTLLFDQSGGIKRVPVGGGTPEAVDIGDATRCSGSHGLSPDGTLMAISCRTPDKPETRVYVLPAGGGAPRMLTEKGNSYFHSWSPDGKTILFTRPDHGASNIYAIAVAGGEERALTTGTGVSDDPDFSTDGKWVYFNSDKAGGMQLWRMKPDGSGAEQVAVNGKTGDDRVNWSPHPSPDGRTLVYISYKPGTTGHPANQDIELRLMDLKDGSVRTLVKLTGGSGTMNVNSWAPDGKHFAFVAYEPVAAK